MGNTDLRIKILSIVVPQATRVGMTEPEHIVKTCSFLEKYVLDSDKVEEQSNSTPVKKMGRPKRTTDKTSSKTETRPRS